MIKREQILADLHMHTLFSLHAYSSLHEMIEMSKKCGYKYIAITDHLYQYDDFILLENETVRIQYLSERTRFEKDIKVIGGAELNLNQDVIDIKKFKDSKCWMPVGLHSWFFDFKNNDLKDLPKFFQDSVDKGYCTAFAHIERDYYKFNNKYNDLTSECKDVLEEIVKIAYKNNIPLELNETSFLFENGGIKDKIYYWIDIAKSLNCKIYLGSDAHYTSELGHFENALKVLNYYNYPPELIMNVNEEELMKLI